MNQLVDLFVKTPVGDSEIFTLEKIEQQGTGLGPIKCSNQMDSISREMLRDGVDMFKFRNAVTIPPLGMIDDLGAIAKCGPQSIILNATINAKINMKRLEFNKSKCVKLHVSKESRKSCTESNARNVKCAFLDVQNSEMRMSGEEKYIGDVISSNGSNDANISRRRSIGIGALSQIFSILNEISYGYQYKEIRLVLRESTLLGKILLSAESWHNLFLYQIEKLEEVDLSFFKQLFNSHSKTATEFYYSETGKIPIRIQVSVKRLLYWWQILRSNKSEMLYKVYYAQKISPVNGDWINLLKTDKSDFGINISDDEVAALSQQNFKDFVKKRSVELTIKYLENLKRNHSKSSQLEVRDMEISPYLVDSRFLKEEREMMFKLRSRTISVKLNFPNAYMNNDMLCDLCQLFPCTQSHPLQCPVLSSRLIVEKNINLRDNFVYGTVDQQLLYVKIYKHF